MLYSDRTLSRKLERTEALASASFVDAHARLTPGCGAEWIEVDGVYAMFDGVGSPLTQTFGLGVFDQITDRELETLESFFKRHGAQVFHEVSPLADASLLKLLNSRGYQPCELTSVLVQEIEPDGRKYTTSNANIATRAIGPDEGKLWARTAAAGWRTEGESLSEFMYDFGTVCTQARGAVPFLAELDGKAISAGLLYLFDDVAILAGASTVPEGRRQGGQRALLDARLRYAAAHGCRIAMMGALPGSQSQRNAESNGFRIAYTRTKWDKTSA